MSEPEPSASQGRVLSWLRDAAIMWSITCLLLGGLLVGLHLVLKARHSGERVFDHYSKLTEFQKAAYAGWKPEELNSMLTATWTPGWIYEPWLGFREKPRESPYVNVSQNGVRKVPGGSASLGEDSAGAVFVFGGSTMFGYGVEDGATVASHLQAQLPGRRVFNLGRAFYYSAQENLFFDALAAAGHKPALAIFVDGLNERCDIDWYQREMGVLFARAQGAYEWRWPEAFYPVTYVLAKLAGRPAPADGTPNALDLHRVECVRYGKSAPLRAVVAENLARRELLCAHHRVTCVTFVQPIAGLHGKHPDFVQHPEAARAALRRKFEHLRETFASAGLVDATTALDGLAAPAYVDGLHYSSEGSRALAARIAAELKARGLPR